MKSCDEITRVLLERRDRYHAQRKEKTKKRLFLAIPLSCLCLAALVSFGLWQAGFFSPAPDDVLAAGDWDDPNSVLCGTYWVPSENEGGSQSVSECSSAPTEGNSAPESGDGTDWAALPGAVTVDGVTYVRFDPGTQAYTPDACLGAAENFPGTYQTMGISAKLFATREDPEVLLVHLPDGSFAPLRKEGK